MSQQSHRTSIQSLLNTKPHTSTGPTQQTGQSRPSHISTPEISASHAGTPAPVAQEKSQAGRSQLSSGSGNPSQSVSGAGKFPRSQANAESSVSDRPSHRGPVLPPQQTPNTSTITQQHVPQADPLPPINAIFLGGVPSIDAARNSIPTTFPTSNSLRGASQRQAGYLAKDASLPSIGEPWPLLSQVTSEPEIFQDPTSAPFATLTLANRTTQADASNFSTDHSQKADRSNDLSEAHLKYVCPACDSIYMSQGSLVQHYMKVVAMRATHDLRQFFICQYSDCAKNFTLLNDREAHYLNEHSQQPPPSSFPCFKDTCWRSLNAFTSSARRSQHMRKGKHFRFRSAMT